MCVVSCKYVLIKNLWFVSNKIFPNILIFFKSVYNNDTKFIFINICKYTLLLFLFAIYHKMSSVKRQANEEQIATNLIN